MFCAAIAVAGGYSCAHAQTVRGTDDQTALGVPRVALNGYPGLALPQPLSPGEAAQVRHIFALQAAGNIAEATHETGLLNNKLLLGHILADRYLSGLSNLTAAELTDWLASYGDQPDAPAIRALRAQTEPDVAPEPPSRKPGRDATGAPVRALLVQNRDAAAVAAAAPLLSHPSPTANATEPLFAGGLAAWRVGNPSMAFNFFQTAWRATRTASLRAADAFWAARAAQREADRGASVVWLRRAAQEIDTFYGRIAARARAVRCRPHAPAVRHLRHGGDARHRRPRRPARRAGGNRAPSPCSRSAKRRAEAELRALWADAGQDAAFARPLALLAHAVGFTQFATELRNAAQFTPQAGATRPSCTRRAGS